jgi:hypothetical protein
VVWDPQRGGRWCGRRLPSMASGTLAGSTLPPPRARGVATRSGPGTGRRGPAPAPSRARARGHTCHRMSPRSPLPSLPKAAGPSQVPRRPPLPPNAAAGSPPWVQRTARQGRLLRRCRRRRALSRSMAPARRRSSPRATGACAGTRRTRGARLLQLLRLQLLRLLMLLRRRRRHLLLLGRRGGRGGEWRRPQVAPARPPPADTEGAAQPNGPHPPTPPPHHPACPPPRWQAAINSSGKYLYLGSYVSETEAARVFDRAALKIRGVKVRPQPPPALACPAACLPAAAAPAPHTHWVHTARLRAACLPGTPAPAPTPTHPPTHLTPRPLPPPAGQAQLHPQGVCGR